MSVSEPYQIAGQRFPVRVEQAARRFGREPGLVGPLPLLPHVGDQSGPGLRVADKIEPAGRLTDAELDTTGPQPPVYANQALAREISRRRIIVFHCDQQMWNQPDEPGRIRRGVETGKPGRDGSLYRVTGVQ